MSEKAQLSELSKLKLEVQEKTVKAAKQLANIEMQEDALHTLQIRVSDQTEQSNELRERITVGERTLAKSKREADSIRFEVEDLKSRKAYWNLKCIAQKSVLSHETEHRSCSQPKIQMSSKLPTETEA